ncbi:hypothetical protein GCM10009837_28930 [Streptomyces durmitorensis]
MGAGARQVSYEDVPAAVGSDEVGVDDADHVGALGSQGFDCLCGLVVPRGCACFSHPGSSLSAGRIGVIV